MQFNTSEISPPVFANQLSKNASALVKTLLYFDIFHYPLNLNELVEYCQFQHINKETACRELDFLIENVMVVKQEDYYLISNKNSLIERRKLGNELAEKKMKTAFQMSEFISKFPFVRCVCISGSLSKNFMAEDSDIDFFIITSTNRLWLCRSLLVLYKKIFLFNSHKHFCINYYLDTKHLEIPDHNIFTATEITFLKPTYNAAMFEEFSKQNNWTEQFYPNKNRTQLEPTKITYSALKSSIEKMLSGWLGEQLDSLFFRITLLRWKKKFTHFSAEEFDLNLRSRKNVSKHHPRGYQKTVLESFQNKVSAFEMQYNVKLH